MAHFLKKLKKTFVFYSLIFISVFAVVLNGLPLEGLGTQLAVVYASHEQPNEQSLKIKFFPRAEDLDKAWKVHLWIPDTTHVFDLDLTKTQNAYEGTLTLPRTTRVGYVLYYGNWQKDLGNQDRFAELTGSSILEVNQGVVETNVSPDQPDSEPEPPQPPAPVVEEKLTRLTLTVHYVREDNQYEGWNIYTWHRKNGQDTDVKVTPFTNKKATVVYENTEGIETIGLIVRKSVEGNDWAAKNTQDDLLLSHFEKNGENAEKEIWIVEADPKIYSSEQAIPPATKIKQLHTEAFNQAHAYHGELGAIYTPERTVFKLWAPTAEKVEVIDYTQSPERNLGQMRAADRHWSLEYNGDAHLMKYRYRLYFEDGSIIESQDPYAKSASANNIYSVVIDSANTVPQGFSTTRMPAFPQAHKAVIYEAHIRDLTIAQDNGITHKGKFLGLTEEGTRTAQNHLSGLDYLKSLGITHIQLLPIFDFASVDENASLAYNAQYNWGYDPDNYNVPEGSYSTNPNDPEARVKELKHLIQTLHNHGIRVIMDVVYNHVYNVERSSLHKTVPGYYFRYDRAGNLYNGTGVGNETASEQPMFRKYMIDSLKYWAKEYNIDGFRFDLMGIHDVETMNQIRAEMDKIDPSIILLGEGWNMGNHPQGVEKSHQYHAAQMPRIAFFNDVFRDAVKGDNFEATHAGYVNQAPNEDNAWKILNSIKSQYVVPYKSIDQNVVYNEAHDNYTLYDKLKQTLPNVTEEKIVRMHTHATTLQALAYGLMFVHAGQENLRTKYNALTNSYEHNSYNLPDSVNAFNYDRANEYSQAHQYFKDLLALRKTEALFDLNSIEEINEKMSHLDQQVKSGQIAYKVLKDDKEYYVLSNAKDVAQAFTLPENHYEVLVNDMRVYLDEKARDKVEGSTFSVAGNSVSILKVTTPPEPQPELKTKIKEVSENLSLKAEGYFDEKTLILNLISVSTEETHRLAAGEGIKAEDLQVYEATVEGHYDAGTQFTIRLPLDTNRKFLKLVHIPKPGSSETFEKTSQDKRFNLQTDFVELTTNSLSPFVVVYEPSTDSNNQPVPNEGNADPGKPLVPPATDKADQSKPWYKHINEAYVRDYFGFIDTDNVGNALNEKDQIPKTSAATVSVSLAVASMFVALLLGE